MGDGSGYIGGGRDWTPPSLAPERPGATQGPQSGAGIYPLKSESRGLWPFVVSLWPHPMQCRGLPSATIAPIMLGRGEMKSPALGGAVGASGRPETMAS